jgi:hypothetical protein
MCLNEHNEPQQTSPACRSPETLMGHRFRRFLDGPAAFDQPAHRSPGIQRSSAPPSTGASSGDRSASTPEQRPKGARYRGLMRWRAQAWQAELERRLRQAAGELSLRFPSWAISYSVATGQLFASPSFAYEGNVVLLSAKHPDQLVNQIIAAQHELGTRSRGRHLDDSVPRWGVGQANIALPPERRKPAP